MIPLSSAIPIIKASYTFLFLLVYLQDIYVRLTFLYKIKIKTPKQKTFEPKSVLILKSA